MGGTKRFHLLRTTAVSFQKNSFGLTTPAISKDEDHEMLVFIGQNVCHVFHPCFLNKSKVKGSDKGEKYHLLQFI